MITIEINHDLISTALANASSRMEDLTPVMQAIGALLRSSTVDRFSTGRGPDGTAWALNSPVTLARKKDTRPLFGGSNRLNNDFGLAAGPNFAEVTTVVEYAAVQQFGAAKGSFGSYSGIDRNGRAYSGSSPWGDIPARPFMGMSAEDEADILNIISEALESALTP